MSDKIQRQLEQAPEMEVPFSTPPSFSELNERVAVVRRRRKTMRVISGMTAAACFLMVSLFLIRPKVDGNRDIQIAGNPSSIIPEPNSVNESLPVEAELETLHQPKIQLYARVVGTAPVFDYDEDTETIHHVGWIESERRVPVDMKYVPQQHQEKFNAALSSDDQWQISF